LNGAGYISKRCSLSTPTRFHPGSPRKYRKPHKIAGNHQFPGRTWENLAGPGRTWVETVGIGDFSGGPGRAAKVSSGKSGWRVARYFDPQFLNFCRRRCTPFGLQVCHALK